MSTAPRIPLGQSLTMPSVSAHPTDTTATILVFDEHVHRLPDTWRIAESTPRDLAVVYALGPHDRVVVLIETPRGIRELPIDSQLADDLRRAYFA